MTGQFSRCTKKVRPTKREVGKPYDCQAGVQLLKRKTSFTVLPGQLGKASTAWQHIRAGFFMERRYMSKFIHFTDTESDKFVLVNTDKITHIVIEHKNEKGLTPVNIKLVDDRKICVELEEEKVRKLLKNFTP